MPRYRSLLTALFAFIILLALVPVMAVGALSAGEHYTAAMLNINNGAAGRIDITVDRWSSDAERTRLMATLEQKGPDKLLDAVRDMPSAGRIGAPGQLSWDLRYARKIPNPDGGERIVLVTDRPINFGEAANQTRSLNYPFTVIELRLDRDGKGQGKMSTATKIVADKKNNTITLENWDLQPVQLTQVKRENSFN